MKNSKLDKSFFDHSYKSKDNNNKKEEFMRLNMDLYNRNPVGNWMDNFTKSIGDLFDESYLKTDKSFLPACDVHENKDYYFFSFDVPGVKREDIQVELRNNTLHVSGEKRNEYENKEKNKGFYEKFYGKFHRSFNLPVSVNDKEIEAHFKNGVLELLIPKLRAESGRQIPVGDGNKGGLFSRLLNDKG